MGLDPGLLSERGIVIEQGVSQVRKRLPEILEDAENVLTSLGVRRGKAALFQWV